MHSHMVFSPLGTLLNSLYMHAKSAMDMHEHTQAHLLEMHFYQLKKKGAEQLRSAEKGGVQSELKYL